MIVLAILAVAGPPASVLAARLVTPLVVFLAAIALTAIHEAIPAAQDYRQLDLLIVTRDGDFHARARFLFFYDANQLRGAFHLLRVHRRDQIACPQPGACG